MVAALLMLVVVVWNAPPAVTIPLPEVPLPSLRPAMPGAQPRISRSLASCGTP